MSALTHGASCKFCLKSMTLSLFSGRGSTGAWGVLRLPSEIDDPAADLGAWQRWRGERPANAGTWSVRRILSWIRNPKFCLLGGRGGIRVQFEFQFNSSSDTFLLGEGGVRVPVQFGFQFSSGSSSVRFQFEIQRSQAGGIKGFEFSSCSSSVSCHVERASALARGATCEFCLKSTTFSLFWAHGSAGAWSLLQVLKMDDPLAALRAWKRWRMERPERPANSA